MWLILQIVTRFIDESLQYATKDLSQKPCKPLVVERPISERKVVYVGSSPVAITQYSLSISYSTSLKKNNSR